MNPYQSQIAPNAPADIFIAPDPAYAGRRRAMLKITLLSLAAWGVIVAAVQAIV